MIHNDLRPESLDDLVGNENIKTILRKQKETGNISHSFLINGSFGLGKTTISRIIANELVGDASVIEVDCGVENSADKMREVVEDSNLGSIYHDNKVYILDEFHRLNLPAQTVLLKTLEEPQDGVYFIIVTSEKNKVSPAIKSRCLLLELEKPSEKDIGNAIRRFLAKHKIKLENQDDWKRFLEIHNGSYRVLYNQLEKLLNVSTDGFVSHELFESTFGGNLDDSDENTKFFGEVFLKNKPFETIEELGKSEHEPYSTAFMLYSYLKKRKNNKHVRILSMLAELLIVKDITLLSLEKLVFDSVDVL